MSIRLLDGQRRWLMENGAEINQWCVERDILVEYVNAVSGMPTPDEKTMLKLVEQWKAGTITEAEAMAQRLALTDDKPSGCILYFTSEQNAFEYKMKWL
ncbi:MAG: hypothetical protein EOP83_10775 [Verrucomicrobiaceae bacterium]|nr:MAG: hypothetical protein EOP83_10775 [Verrucomicrobiaceae bacterium]